ncbi:TIGR02444 family protein [Pseudomonas sp. No.21]|uniref:TIGR02444 family protein n=1 Tax=Pseudomonas TaxID=286 RepID=UPI000DA725FE|nr:MULTISPECIES: TIGR02444 family protein [Pseudomonas]MDW3715905.1 TIGR02444 family protein [Pseudomonas sp. 2023EL-01195]PZE13305.1 TIGR02444 family protein [Pseudomonas sp. 57B-090624]GJN46800.1 TIGR02444 family protein [Pseudomonas tohonis]
MPPDLWSFALDLYARPGVEDACLRLQERGADVCLLLAGAWLARRGVRHDDAREEQLRLIAEPWQREVVEPLRALRRGWREAAAMDEELRALREAVKRLELDAERRLLARLEQAAAPWPEAAGHDVDWLEGLAGKAGESDRDALQSLRVAALEA